MEIEGFRNVLAEAGPLAGVASIDEFDEGPSWAVVIDEDTAVLIEWAEEPRRAVFYAPVGALEEDAPASAILPLLRYGAAWRETGGLRIALDVDDVLVLLLDLTTDELDAPALARVLGGFAEALRTWRDALDKSVVSAVPAADAAPDGPESVGIRV